MINGLADKVLLQSICYHSIAYGDKMAADAEGLL